MGKLFRKFKKSHLEKAILDLNKKDIKFIQIGACDGESFDPIFKLIKNNKWQGVLVEPIPRYFNKLKDNYKNSKGLHFVNKAIGNGNDKVTMYTISEEGLNFLPKWTIGISSIRDDKNALSESYWKTEDAKQHIKRGVTYELIKKYTEAIEVDSIRFMDLLDEFEIKDLDLLQIDAEGFDFEIIKQIDFDKIVPKIIHFEFNSLTETEKKECKKLLENNGYKFSFYSKMDALAIKN